MRDDPDSIAAVDDDRLVVVQLKFLTQKSIHSFPAIGV